jgi:hypothetical protein
MKFKTKEDLLRVNNELFDDRDAGFNSGIIKAFHSFAERVEFYKKYGIGTVADPWNTLKREEPDLFQSFCDYIHTKHGELTYGSEVWINHYRECLYGICFGDIE